MNKTIDWRERFRKMFSYTGELMEDDAVHPLGVMETFIQQELDLALREQKETLMSHTRPCTKLLNPRKGCSCHLRKVIDLAVKERTESLKKENILLKSDVMRAIGFIQGLGHHDSYLKSKYLKQEEKEWKV